MLNVVLAMKVDRPQKHILSKYKSNVSTVSDRQIKQENLNDRKEKNINEQTI